jgi:ketosteroid isomerase-like protein
MGPTRKEAAMETQAAADFVAAVFAALNRRDYVKASQYFAADVTITGAEFGVLKGPDAVIGHFHQSG